MTTEERQAYFDQNGVYPIEDSDIPEAERMTPPTAEQIIEGEATQLKLNAKRYLRDTDWYVSRKAEADIPIPVDILALRQQARLDASS
jgi:hypothetical protein|tara:strand:+ start:103 stop:366 length:264 start_codon:yes stop_codon:yes gene_type:complete